MEAYRWVTARDGEIPPGAVPHGYEQDGEPLWVCRAAVHGGVHPGKVRPGLGMAAVAWGGTELGVAEYEVLVDRGVWGVAAGGTVPPDAFPAGHENGAPLYVARAAIARGALHIGKVRAAFGAAHIGYGNGEHPVHAYEILLHPAGALRLPPPPDELTSLVVRTDFEDERRWASLTASIGEAAAFVSDPAFAGVTIQGLLDAAAGDDRTDVLFLADAEALADPEHALLAVDLADEPGRTFRVPARFFEEVSANLMLANMDFAEFAHAARDGTFRGFG